jgi:hypothetical protein
MGKRCVFFRVPHQKEAETRDFTQHFLKYLRSLITGLYGMERKVSMDSKLPDPATSVYEK